MGLTQTCCQTNDVFDKLLADAPTNYRSLHIDARQVRPATETNNRAKRGVPVKRK